MTDLLQHSLISQLTYDEEIRKLREENLVLSSKINDAYNQLRRLKAETRRAINARRVHCQYSVLNEIPADCHPPEGYIRQLLAEKLTDHIMQQIPVGVTTHRTHTEYSITLDVSPCLL